MCSFRKETMRLNCHGRGCDVCHGRVAGSEGRCVGIVFKVACKGALVIGVHMGYDSRPHGRSEGIYHAV